MLPSRWIAITFPDFSVGPVLFIQSNSATRFSVYNYLFDIWYHLNISSSIRSGSLNVFLVVMLNSDCSLHTSEESIDTTVKQSPSYLPVHNFPHLLKSACNEIGRGSFVLFAKKKILWNFTAFWFKAVSSTFTLSCVRGFDLATSPLRVL